MTSTLLYSLLLYPILFILPAWFASATPVLLGGGTPLDFNRKLGGKPIFGNHKTVRGTISGLAAGILVSWIESALFTYPLMLGVALTAGAVAGDLIGSFIKRRMGHKEGANVILMDQYLFFLVALFVALPYIGFFPSIWGLIVIAILTGVLHRLANILAHKAGIKKVPW